jgi:hypothetical protein
MSCRSIMPKRNSGAGSRDPRLAVAARLRQRQGTAQGDRRSRFFCHRGVAGEGRARSWQVATQPFTSSDGEFLQYCPSHRCYASLPSPRPEAKMGQMSNRSSNRRGLRFLGSFRNFAHRQEALGSFRKSVASALRLPCSVYEISEIGLTDALAIRPLHGLCARPFIRSAGRESGQFAWRGALEDTKRRAPP